MELKYTILYVDDEVINLKLFEMNFKRKYKVITALNGSDGLEKLRSNTSVNFVVSDMRMPGMNGLEFIKIAKNEFPDIIFFILTGFDITIEIADALDSKLVDKYFSKPFNSSEINQSFEKLIQLIEQK